MNIKTNTFLIGMLLSLGGFLNAQKPVKDTLTYLKKFEINKEKYIGKPFSLLLKDMAQLQPTKARSDIKEDRDNPLPSTVFTFSERNISSGNQPSLVITWKPDDSPTTPLEFFQEEHNYRFTVSEKNYFEKKIIRNMVVSK